MRSAPEASGFPVHWDDPADELATFTIDLMHQPNPVSPLSQTTSVRTFPYGWMAAGAELNLPLGKPDVRYHNFYQFERQHVPEPMSPEAAEAQEKLTQETMQREIGRLGERWRDEHLPRLEQMAARMESIEAAIPTASNDEILSLMDELVLLGREYWTIHFRIAFPMLLALQLFDELHTDLFGGAAADAHALLVGRPTMSVKAGIGLFELAADARRSGVDDVILSTPLEEMMPALARTAAGRDFLDQLRDYLATFGLRQDLFDVMMPTWRENPSIALASIRAYLINEHDPRADHEAQAQSAEDAVAKARAQLATYPAPVREQFEAMLQGARDAAFLQEEHNFHIDQNALGWTHLIFVGIGRRLVEMGLIDAPDDIFMLRFEEVQALLAGAADSQASPATRETVAERRTGMAWARTLTPPPFIGQPPKGPPDNVIGRAMTNFFGAPPQVADAPDQLKGSPGSRGVVSGPAFIARSLDEAKAIQPGQILVAMTTMPAWTPFFGVAAAVVTETGGALSHCAIVAREYGIPAVVGAHGAMRAISPGQMIKVDGDRGIVSLSSADA
jgi:pyruvate,water dikinase